MQTAVKFAAIGMLVIIAYGDVRTRRIPNVLAAGIAMLGLVRMIIDSDPIATAHTFEAGAAVFAAAFLLFWCGVLGGGDAKLVAAMALVIGYDDLFGFLFLMSVCGGALALAILARDKLSLQPWHHPRPATTPSATEALGSIGGPPRSTVPYGVAIAMAGVIMLILQTPSAK